MIYRFRQVLLDMFDKPPKILSDPPQTVSRFLVELTDQVGPLFIVLDGIGAAFEDNNLCDLESRDMFMKFCSNIVGKWLSKKNIFFVLLGRGSFMSYVAVTYAQLMHYRFTFSRLSMPLLRPEEIKTIMEKTFADSVENGTIKDVYQLSNSQVDEAAQHLFHQTCGHPESLMTAFKNCGSFSDLMEYNQPAEIDDYKLFYSNLKKYREHVLELLATVRAGGTTDH